MTQALSLFLASYLRKIEEKCPNYIGSPHRWIRLVERSSTEVSGPSEVPRFVGKLFFSVFSYKLSDMQASRFSGFYIPNRSCMKKNDKIHRKMTAHIGKIPRISTRGI